MAFSKQKILPYENVPEFLKIFDQDAQTKMIFPVNFQDNFRDKIDPICNLQDKTGRTWKMKVSTTSEGRIALDDGCTIPLRRLKATVETDIASSSQTTVAASFKSQLTKRNKRYFNIPTKFWRSHLMNKDRILAILEYDDKTWISFIKETTDRIILDAGWPEFFKDNPLYVGMKLKFKLMNTNDIKFRVSITKDMK
ncbi:uncharacterized protein LOC125191768 [Salvia hispanica]|uniref:uncharacterized protein LOC125191768 n=1 Tax=Salvia hispanica TaxID=49212 RepID=UPI002008FA17|nr:uncharacterized protein LOC125191768 [Salvia hispanica]